ncbi:MAG TPA: 1-acyl-sn-glycerol-3-phosphate acyltransferase, partial [Limnobacter sp.]|nr:1-acyl-sn-glycerol-3-phosphate acyltransferase [Limnobacter sp.]
MRQVWTALRLFCHLLFGLAIALALWPMLSAKRRACIEQRFASKLMRILNVRVQVEYQSPLADYAVHGPCLLYSNHVSWLDIFAFNAVCP